MNPQQFQNLGMGRGMPMQMNPAFSVNPQQMGQMGGQQMPMQGMPQQANVGHPQIQKYIFTTLQGQGPFSGWQATVNVNERAAQVKLLVDSLRLVRPPVELPRALEVALQFERKCFSQSTGKEEYFRECSEKLGKIRDQRAQQMSQAVNNMQGMQGMQMSNPNTQMQISQNMMGQQNMQMNMPPNMQQMQQPQMMAQRNMQTMQNQPQMIQNQPSFQGQQTPQQHPQQKPNQAEGLSAEDNKAINLRAADLAKSTPKDKMRQIVDGMAPQLRHNLQQRGVDPIIYYFRMMATKEFRRQKAMEGGGAAQMQGNQMTNQQQTPSMNQATGQTPFLDRYQGLQGEGLRAQETGEMVVPASNNNSGVPDSIRITQQMLANSQRMGQQNPNAMNPNYLEQQRRLQQNQKMQQAARLQAESQQNARPAGSMPPTSVQNTPQGGTPLSSINRPVNLNVQGVSPQPGSRPASRTPVLNQQGQPQPGQQPMNMQEAQQRERILASYPVQIQNILRQKPTSEWKATLQALQQNPAMQRSASQQPQNMQRQQSAQLQQGVFLGGANIGTPMQQSLSAGAMGPQGSQQPVPPNQAQMNPEMVRQRQLAMQQQQQQRMQAGQVGQGAGSQQPQQLRPLNPQQMNFMDNQPVPPNVLNAVRSQVQLPPEIATWISLKQWVMSNPIPNMPIQRVMQYQAQHFAYMMKNRQQAQQQQQGQQPQQVPVQQQQPIPQGQMQNVSGQQAFPNQPQLAAPNDQDIQRLRAQNPRLQNMTDDQVRQAIINRQRQQLHEAMRQQGAQRSMQLGQVPPQQQPQKQQPQPPNAQVQQPARPPGQATQAKPPQTSADKGVKRPNESRKADSPAQTAKPAMPPQRVPNMTREQYDALPQAKKVQLLDQQMVQRLVAIAKQVQSTMPKLQPVKMDPAARQKMMGKLTEEGTKNMVNRFDQLLLAFYKQNKDDNEMRGLIFSKLQLFSQYEQSSISNKTWVPVQNFTITSERVEEILKDLRTRFSTMTAGIAQQQQQQRQQQPALLTPENLSRLQEQEDRKKSIKGGKDVPPAPTTTQPPLQIGDDRGHGAPKYAGTGLKQEDLKLDPKRRKKNPPGGHTPASLSATPPAPSPQVTKSQPPSQSQVFRCPDPNCERNKQGFFSQAEVIEHTKDVHQIDTEPVTDPLAFLDASLRDAFNLDENFKQIKKSAPMAPPMEKTASKASITNLKNESKPATPAAMSKISSQSGRPLSAQLNKDDMGLKAQAGDWEHTKITLEELNNIFGDMDWEEAVPAAALELQDKFIRQYQQSEEWQKLIRTPGGSLTETTTEKSTSPPNAANKELEGKTEGGEKKDDLFVDLEFDGLDLTGLEELDAEPTHPMDTIMTEGEGDSPFEILDKPGITAEQQLLLDNGIDYTRPETLKPEQKRLMEFIVEPFAVGTEPAFDDVPWEDIDWEAEKRQREEDIRLGTPGAWNGHGFNRFP